MFIRKVFGTVLTPVLRPMLAVMLALSASAAAAFPDKPVRLVVPYPVGGATDGSARILAERLAQLWGQAVVVENRPGALGTIGTEHVVKSAADGYTLLLQVGLVVSNELVRPGISYRTQRDLVPVTRVFVTPITFVAGASAPAGGLTGLLAAARAQPGGFSYGTVGEGTAPHYMGEKLRSLSGAQLTAVPYNGDGPLTIDLLGGHLKAGFLSGLNAKKASETGKVRILAVASAERSPLLPDVPTFQEQGFEGFERDTWGLIFAPAGTPAAIVDQIARDITKVVRSKEVNARFADIGLVATGGTPAESLQDVQREQAYWTRTLKEFGVLSKP